jgi:hypothetical protein
MDIEICLIGGISVGIELQELDKTYLCIDLLLVRILISKNTDEDNDYAD